MRSYIKVRQVESHWYRLIRLREAEKEERQEVSALGLALDLTDFLVLFHVSCKHHTQTVSSSFKSFPNKSIFFLILLWPSYSVRAQPSLNHLVPSYLSTVQKGACGLQLGLCPASLWCLDLCQLDAS